MGKAPAGRRSWVGAATGQGQSSREFLPAQRAVLGSGFSPDPPEQNSRGFMARDGKQGKAEPTGRGCHVPGGAILGCSQQRGVSGTRRSKRPWRGGPQGLQLCPCQPVPGHLSPPKSIQALPALTQRGLSEGLGDQNSEGRQEPPHISTESLLLLILPAPASPQPRAEPFSMQQSIPWTGRQGLLTQHGLEDLQQQPVLL